MSRPGKQTAKHKERRAKSWKKAQDQKAANILEQEERTKINAEYRKRGERTPSQQRKRDAFEARIRAHNENVVKISAEQAKKWAGTLDILAKN